MTSTSAMGIGLQHIALPSTMQSAPLVVIYPSMYCSIAFRFVIIGNGLPVEINTPTPLAFAWAMASTVDCGIWCVLKLTSVPSISKNNAFTLSFFTLKQIKKLGPLENIIKMLPQARKMGLNNVNVNPKDMAHVEAIILSMTPYERRHPEVLKASRKQRIAKGSGRSVEEVNRLLNQFEQMKKIMKQVSNGNMKLPF